MGGSHSSGFRTFLETYRRPKAKREAELKADREAQKYWAKPGTEQWDAWYRDAVRSASRKPVPDHEDKLLQHMDDLAAQGKPWLAPSEWPWWHPNSRRKAIAA
jgi:hypothetical protein